MTSHPTWLQDCSLGEWWLPELPNVKIVGVLRVVDEEWQLHVYGCFGLYELASRNRRYPRIQGWIPSAGFLELQECVATIHKFFEPQEYQNKIEKINFFRLIRQGSGAVFFPEKYQSVAMRSPKLFEWVAVNGLAELPREEVQDEVELSFTYRYRRPAAIEKVWGNGKVLLFFTAGSFPMPLRRKLHITQDCAVQLVFLEGLSFPEYEIKKRNFSAFVSLLSGGFHTFEFFSATSLASADSSASSSQCDVFSNRKLQPIKKVDSIRDEDVFFCFADIAAQLEELIICWDSVIERYGNSFVDYWLNTYEGRESDRFLDICKLLHSLVEIDERKLKNNDKVRVTFKDSIIRCIGNYSKLNTESIANVVKNIEATRHTLAHPQSDLKDLASSGVELSNLSEFLDSIFRCCVWYKVGIPLNKILNRCFSNRVLENKLAMNYWIAVK